MSEVSGAPWLVRRPLPERSARARLFCFPYAGVGASAYRLWPAALPPSLEVCAIQLPGRESRLREPAYTRIDSAVAALLPVLEPHFDLPFAFFGHSMGAVLATEITLALAARVGAPLPHHLFVSGRRAPGLPDPDPPLAALPDAAFLAELNRRYGGIPAEVMQDAEMMALLLPCLRADIAALESYAPASTARIPVPVSAFGGTEDSRVSPAHIEAWRTAAAGEFRVRMFPGNHFFITPRRTELLAQIGSTLAPLLDSGREMAGRSAGVA
jgi:medium-chain acyl-[acyl-carrier-protein] hydrolase